MKHFLCVTEQGLNQWKNIRYTGSYWLKPKQKREGGPRRVWGNYCKSTLLWGRLCISDVLFKIPFATAGKFTRYVQSKQRTIITRHNGHDSVSYHQTHDCLLNRSKKYQGNSPETGEFHAQMVSNAENVSIWWRHRDESNCRQSYSETNSD